MSIKTAIYSFLTNDIGVAAIVDDRVYPNVIPQQVFDAASKRPCLVYRREGLEQTSNVCATELLQKSVFSIDCYARTYEAADMLATAVKAAFESVAGIMAGVAVNRVFLDDEFDLDDPDPGLFRSHLVFSIWHY